jgi:hypothetical protein
VLCIHGEALRLQARGTVELASRGRPGHALMLAWGNSQSVLGSWAARLREKKVHTEQRHPFLARWILGCVLCPAGPVRTCRSNFALSLANFHLQVLVVFYREALLGLVWHSRSFHSRLGAAERRSIESNLVLAGQHDPPHLLSGVGGQFSFYSTAGLVAQDALAQARLAKLQGPRSAQHSRRHRCNLFCSWPDGGDLLIKSWTRS